ncbi:hypothetical protein TNCV_3319531 [Trichonephila clavipes]|nr:hypothetical protein TNCV_3319531 [Trichonephila clavipes]
MLTRHNTPVRTKKYQPPCFLYPSQGSPLILSTSMFPLHSDEVLRALESVNSLFTLGSSPTYPKHLRKQRETKLSERKLSATMLPLSISAVTSSLVPNVPTSFRHEVIFPLNPQCAPVLSGRIPDETSVSYIS